MYKIYQRILCDRPGRVKEILFIMRLTVLLLIASMLQVSANSFGQQVTLHKNKVALEEVFKEIMVQTGYNVLWQPDKLKKAKPVSVNFNNTGLKAALNELLVNQPFTYTIDGNTIVIKQQEKGVLNSTFDLINNLLNVISVRGVILDENNNPISGATVRVKGTKMVVVTNERGVFEIAGLDKDAVLSISFIGYKSVEVKASSASFPLKLEPSLEGLQEVMINTGYQTLPLERSTGSFGVVSEKVLNQRIETNILNRLEGTVPGLFMYKGAVTVRGLSTIYGEQQPLYVVDGFPYEGNIDYLNTNDIVSVVLLSDAAAASIYGTRAANGVIVITTRLGSAKKLTVNYNSSFFITPTPDASYLNFMNAKEVVDLQEELFNKKTPADFDYTSKYALPKAVDALARHQAGKLTTPQLNDILNNLRTLDAQSQFNKFLLQNHIKQQHNFSASGGNDINQFNLSLNYIKTRTHNIGSNYENTNISLRDQAKVFKWLTADVGVTTNLGKSKSSPINGLGYYSYLPYEVLKDKEGNNVPWNYFKSKTEIDRLKGLGLYDETYNPLEELDRSDISNRSNYVRLQGGFNVAFMKGLKLDVKYQTEIGNVYYKTLESGDAYGVRQMINDATTIKEGVITRNVPDGSQIYETRGDSRSYTVRAQLDFNRDLSTKSQITAIAGAEQRATHNTSTASHRMGFNERNQKFIPVNSADLRVLKGTESLTGDFNYDEAQYNGFYDNENRYISFYANAGYSYDNRFNLTGSVRIDDSNLFGTNPKYRYVPLWSFGGSWKLSNERFLESTSSWLNNLNLRLTYGLSGNVAKNVGPFLLAASEYNIETKAESTTILYPPNKSLRWEKTAVTNLGLDFGILKNRISGSVSVYNRKSTDLLGNMRTDPTNAFTSALLNYGSLTNKGFELALNTDNIKSSGFNWSTRLSYSINKNKMTKISNFNESVYSYTEGNGAFKVGYPINSIFNFRWAGLDPTNGSMRVFDKDGNVVINYDQNGAPVANMKDVEGLVYGGTLLPTYTIGLTNTFNYKNLSLNVMIIANGGNVFRDATPPVLTTSNFSRNMDRRVLNFWRQPGDENKPGIMPAPMLTGAGDSYFSSLWYAADINTLKADYIKVRDISLQYDFASLIDKKTFSSAKLILQVQNAFSWYRNSKGLDPEAYTASSVYANRTLPVMQCYTLGINLTF